MVTKLMSTPQKVSNKLAIFAKITKTLSWSWGCLFATFSLFITYRLQDDVAGFYTLLDSSIKRITRLVPPCQLKLCGAIVLLSLSVTPWPPAVTANTDWNCSWLSRVNKACLLISLCLSIYIFFSSDWFSVFFHERKAGLWQFDITNSLSIGCNMPPILPIGFGAGLRYAFFL